jgi:hypothetical protein
MQGIGPAQRHPWLKGILMMKPLGLSQNTCKIFQMSDTGYGIQTKKKRYAVKCWKV